MLTGNILKYYIMEVLEVLRRRYIWPNNYYKVKKGHVWLAVLQVEVTLAACPDDEWIMYRSLFTAIRSWH